MKLLVSSMLAASAAATPLYSAAKPAVRARDVTVTEAGVSSLAFYAQWAAATYCNSLATPGTAISCANSTCTGLEANKATVLANLGSESSLTDLLGFVGYDPTLDQIAINFRGSKSVRNWLEDFTFGLEDCSAFVSDTLASAVGDGCKMHQGFGLGWAGVSAETFSALAAAKAAHPNAAVVVTGHSLGAAVATIAAADLRANGTTLDLFTYGSPRVGNKDLVAFMSTQGPVGSLGISGVSNHRVTHLNDPVPQVPPIVVTTYAHTSPEFWLSDDGTPAATTESGYFAGKLDYTPSEVKVCSGYLSLDCNAGQPSLNTTAHSFYFERISGCGSSSLYFK